MTDHKALYKALNTLSKVYLNQLSKLQKGIWPGLNSWEDFFYLKTEVITQFDCPCKPKPYSKM